ncbi:MAG: hypothetical protein ISS71_07945 [Phycisphaerae bacterium]|nr:hypothetical protein [Phycisphaerae bacterium]
MSVKKWTGLMLVLIAVAGFVFAEAQQEEKSQDAAVRERMQQGTSAARERGMAGREQMYRERMAKQAEAHRAEMQELIDIKKIAEEENAAKTAEAIQALIDKKNAEYQKGVEQVERARREQAERLQKRMEKAHESKEKAADTDSPDKSEETSGEGGGE